MTIAYGQSRPEGVGAVMAPGGAMDGPAIGRGVSRALPDWIMPQARAWREAELRGADAGQLIVVPVPDVQAGNRVLATARNMLEACGFSVVVVRGAPACGSTEVATPVGAHGAAERGVCGSPVVLIVQDSHLLPPGRLEMLARVPGLAVLAARAEAGPEGSFGRGVKPVATAMPGEACQAARPAKGHRIAPLLISFGIAWLTFAGFVWEAAQHVPSEVAQPVAPEEVPAQPVGSTIDQAGDSLEPRASPSGISLDPEPPPETPPSTIDQAGGSLEPRAGPSGISLDPEPPPETPPADTPAVSTPTQPQPSVPAAVPSQAVASSAAQPIGAPGLLIRAKPGETLQTLYRRIYRGVTPPPFAEVAAKNPEPIRPGDILTFPAPVNGWHSGDY